MINKISAIEESYLSRLKKTGESFNLISIMKMETNERYTHSAIIAELLDPDGNHGYDNLFLKLFLETVGYNHFSPDTCTVSVEHYGGTIATEDYSSRTFVDIVIRNGCKQEILIENKIWAADQPLQLERTRMAARSADLKLIYLTPFGTHYAQNTSIEYDRISYQNHISSWLDKCISASVQTPLVSNSIKIYKNVVDKITNQNIYAEMNEKIKEEILLSKQNFKTAQLIYSNYIEMLSRVNVIFWEYFTKELGAPLADDFNCLGHRCIYEISEQKSYGDTVYIQIKFFDAEGITVLDNKEINDFVESLRTDFHGDSQHSNKDWNIWFFADKGNTLHNTFISDLSVEDKYDLLTKGDFNGQIKEVATEFRRIIDNLRTVDSCKKNENLLSTNSLLGT